MLALSKPDLILTHESDLDGYVAGILLQRLSQKLFGESAPLEAWNYVAWQRRELTEKAAWVTDLTFETRLDKPGWTVIDHHQTAAVPRHARLIHDTTKSAGLLCYEICCAHGLGNAALDRLVQLSNLADLFQDDAPEFPIALDYASLVKSYGFWNLHDLTGGRLETLLDHPLLEVMATKRRVEDPIGYEWSKGRVERISPTVGRVHTTVGNPNLIVHRLLEENATPYAVLMTLFVKANRTVVVSLRSRHGEALPVARQLQGGGHENACGATLPRSVQNESDAIEYLRRTLDPAAARPTGLNPLADLLGTFEAKG
jgi:hypothetical protein